MRTNVVIAIAVGPLFVNLFFCSRSNLATLVPVCEDCKEEVLSCYQRNPKKSLNCSAEVKAYARCVESARKVW